MGIGGPIPARSVYAESNHDADLREEAAMFARRLVVIGALICGLAVDAVAQPRVTWVESGIRNGEPWREVTTVEIGDDAVRAATRHSGDRVPFLGVEYRLADGLLRISVPEVGPVPIEVTAAQLDEMEAAARQAAPALFEHPLRRGKLFRMSSTAEVAGVACTNYGSRAHPNARCA